MWYLCFLGVGNKIWADLLTVLMQRGRISREKSCSIQTWLLKTFSYCCCYHCRFLFQENVPVQPCWLDSRCYSNPRIRNIPCHTSFVWACDRLKFWTWGVFCSRLRTKIPEFVHRSARQCHPWWISAVCVKPPILRGHHVIFGMPNASARSVKVFKCQNRRNTTGNCVSYDSCAQSRSRFVAKNAKNSPHLLPARHHHALHCTCQACHVTLTWGSASGQVYIVLCAETVADVRPCVWPLSNSFFSLFLFLSSC